MSANLGRESGSPGRVIRQTRGVCPDCRSIVPAEIVRVSNRILISGKCSHHGPFSSVVSEHGAFYEKVDRYVRVAPSLPIRFARGQAPHVNGVFIDLTTRCNLRCACCLASSSSLSLPEPDLGETLEWLTGLPRRPIICLSGGEPTLRDDLTEWISALTARGYMVKLLTNGLKLEDLEYTRSLREAGLRWVMIQFDSLNDSTLGFLRGHPLAERRLKAIDNSSRCGLNIVLPCVIVPGVNDDQLWEIVRWAQTRPRIKQLSFLPAARQGDYRLPDETTTLEAADIMDLLGSQSNGRVARDDFLNAFKWSSRIYRLTGLEHFATRRCFYPLILLRNPDSVAPLLQAKPTAARLGAAWKLARALLRRRPLEWEPDGGSSTDLLYVTIETFRELNNLDVDDAGTCSRYYLSGGSLTPACLFNLLCRDQDSDNPDRREPPP